MNIFNKFKSHSPVFLVIIVISFYLVLKWLPDGAIIAGGDIGIPNLLPQKQLGDVISSWWDTHGTGISSPTGYTSIPYYLFLSALDILGFKPEFTQKLVFFLILSGGAISIYFIGLLFSFKRWTAVISSLFYIFNLTALSVWQRGVHNAMLMLLLAPLSLLILVWGINKRKYSSIIFINIVSFLLSYVFGALGYVFSLWLLWTVYIAVMLLDNWKDKKLRRFVLVYFLILAVSWVGTNIWWILHLLTSSKYVLGQYNAEELKARGSDVLVALKPYHESSYILRGLSRFYHYVVKDWGEGYFNPFFIILSWIPTAIIFSTTLIKKNYNLTNWKFLISLSITVLFLSKGVNAPLGDLNKLPFDFFQFLAPLRNTYEKVGILLPIPFSLLLALGVSQLATKIYEKKLGFLNSLIYLVVFALLTILVWPLWLGKLFISEGKKYAVTIPSYYQQANEWFKTNKSDDSRILQLPMAWGESIDYNWTYTGIEPSQYFFDGSSIGYHLGIAAVDSRLRDLLILIHNQDTVNIQKAIASLNIGWIVIHNETLYRDRILENPERINSWLSTAPYFLEYVKNIGPLAIWKVKDEYRLGHFYSVDKLLYYSRPKTLSALGIWNDIEKQNDSFLTEIQKTQEKDLNKFISKRTIYPDGKIKYTPLGSINAEVALKEIAIVNRLPDSTVYPLITLKENILSFFNQDDKVRGCFSLSGKRLKEAALLARQNKLDQANKSLKNYEKQLEKCTKINKDTLSIYLNTGFLRDEILGQLIRQRAVLDNEFTNSAVSGKSMQAKSNLNGYLAKLGLSPKFEPKQQLLNKQIVVFNYNISKKGRYSIKLTNIDKNLLKSPPTLIQIDDRDVRFSPVEVDEKYILYPQNEFNEGFHEIHLQVDQGENLIKEQIENKKNSLDPGFTIETSLDSKESVFTGEAISGPSNLVFDLPNIDVSQTYEVTFDVYFNQGAPPIFVIANNTDPVDPYGRIKPGVRMDLEFVSYPIQWNKMEFDYTPALNANSAKMMLTLLPWNDCLAQLPVQKCLKFYLDMGTNYKADRPSISKFKNFKVEKIFNSNLVLDEIDRVDSQQLGKVKLEWKKQNPVSYDVNLSNQNPPYIIVFSETFHPLWEITDTLGKKIDLDHFSINGLVNGWLVDQKLPEKIQVRFVLQNELSKGIIISVLSFILMLVIPITLDAKRKR